ncbi:hypothetical protein BW13_11255 [Bifidobacterium sp. UTCIF-37]|uniref:InlB B-repeat-containing protein n=1 Tax=Bifidobacterium sp. UTCIF-37 TaxID=1465259 RepID=UPI0015E3CCF4|nr:InlB B-repeat-containing protein [Bifidobacterium sp. UTCIF-37]TPF85364.1 hypothetical protein BW13_11255 [Bifidobacterium sp. UTCIF-37]
MTGNNKVWRAPLAGLASVAMLATMGLVAGTASAAGTATVDQYNFKVTLDAGSISGVGDGAVDGSKTKSFYFNDLDTNHNGKLDELYTNLYTLTTPGASYGNKFTGWYTSPEAGAAKFDFKNTYVTKAITLYAHYAEPDDIVTFRFAAGSDGVKRVEGGAYGSADTNARSFATDTTAGTAQYRLTVSKKDKKIAKWELPNDIADSALVTKWEADQTGAGKITDDITFDDLTSDFTNKLGYNNPSTNDVTLKPSVTSDAVKVNFNGSTASSVDVAYNSTVSLPTAFKSSDAHALVTKWNYNYAGKTKEWTKDDKVSSVFDPELNLRAADFAPYYTVRFYTKVNYRNVPVADAQIVAANATATKPADPSRDDYTFAGWSEKDGYGQDDFDFAKAISKDTDLYAQWSANKATVTFDYNYAGKKTTKSYASGETFSLPTDATRDGYTNLGWYTKVVPSEFVWLKVRDNVFGSATFNKDIWVQVPYGTTAKYVSDVKGVRLSDFAQYQIPSDAQLKIDPTTGTLQYLKSTQTEVAPGKYETTTQWIDVDKTLYASWQKSDKDTLAPQEQQVPTDSTGEVTDTANYTAASRAAYAKAYKAYLAHKDQLGTSDGELTADEAATLQAELTAAQALLVQTTPVKVIRLVNGAKHLYSTDVKEQNFLKNNGWKVEGVAFYATDKTAPKSTPVYRLRNTADGSHLLSTDANEVKVLTQGSWEDEGVVFYAPQGATDSVKRFWKAGSEHLYTADLNEYKYNTTKAGWTGDDTVFVAAKTQVK